MTEAARIVGDLACCGGLLFALLGAWALCRMAGISERHLEPMSALAHDLEQLADGTYRCKVCWWQWSDVPQTDCPGFARLRSWSEVPPTMASRSMLRRWGLRPDRDPVGLLVLSDQGAIWLYELDKARMPRSRTPAQIQALADYRMMKAIGLHGTTDMQTEDPG